MLITETKIQDKNKQHKQKHKSTKQVKQQHFIANTKERKQKKTNHSFIVMSTTKTTDQREEAVGRVTAEAAEHAEAAKEAFNCLPQK